MYKVIVDHNPSHSDNDVVVTCLQFPTDPPRVRTITFFAYPPSLLELVTERILGFDNHCYLTPSLLPYEGSLSFGRQI